MMMRFSSVRATRIFSFPARSAGPRTPMFRNPRRNKSDKAKGGGEELAYSASKPLDASEVTTTLHYLVNFRESRLQEFGNRLTSNERYNLAFSGFLFSALGAVFYNLDQNIKEVRKDINGTNAKIENFSQQVHKDINEMKVLILSSERKGYFRS